MFSRAAKSVVKTLGHRKYHAGEENIKITVLGVAGEVSEALSLSNRSPKFDAIALYDATTLGKGPYNNSSKPTFRGNEPFGYGNSRMLMMADKSRSSDVARQHDGGLRNDINVSNQKCSLQKNQTDELIDTLHRLPIAEATDASNEMTAQGKPVDVRNLNYEHQEARDVERYRDQTTSSLIATLPAQIVWNRQAAAIIVEDRSANHSTILYMIEDPRIIQNFARGSLLQGNKSSRIVCARSFHSDMPERSNTMGMSPNIRPLYCHFEGDSLRYRRKQVIGPDYWLIDREVRIIRRKTIDGGRYLIGDQPRARVIWQIQKPKSKVADNANSTNKPPHLHDSILGPLRNIRNIPVPYESVAPSRFNRVKSKIVQNCSRFFSGGKNRSLKNRDEFRRKLPQLQKLRVTLLTWILYLCNAVSRGDLTSVKKSIERRFHSFYWTEAKIVIIEAVRMIDQQIWRKRHELLKAGRDTLWAQYSLLLHEGRNQLLKAKSCAARWDLAKTFSEMSKPILESAEVRTTAKKVSSTVRLLYKRCIQYGSSIREKFNR